uniref:WIBG Mago-binding domain-containing protein n=1 Tax=Acidobacterium capsulatum TaxID=33075 RepID=A0A7V5CU77_9BACT
MKPSHHGIALLIASVGAAFSRNRRGRLGPTFPRALGIPLFPACEQQHRRADGSLRKDFRIREILHRVNEIERNTGEEPAHIWIYKLLQPHRQPQGSGQSKPEGVYQLQVYTLSTST